MPSSERGASQQGIDACWVLAQEPQAQPVRGAVAHEAQVGRAGHDEPDAVRQADRPKCVRCQPARLPRVALECDAPGRSAAPHAAGGRSGA